MTQILEKFTKRTDAARAELDARQQELDERAQKAAELQTQAQHLQHECDLCSDNLLNAVNQAQAFKLRLQELTDLMPTIWAGAGARQLTTHDSYQGIVEIERALSDWPRVESILKSKLKDAQAALAAFEKSNASFFQE